VTQVTSEPRATPPDSITTSSPADIPTDNSTSPLPQINSSDKSPVTEQAEEPEPPSPSLVPPDAQEVGRLRRAALVARRNWPVFVVLALFAAAATVVPTMTDIATTDDWGYTRSVELLYWDVELRIFPVVAATAVGQVLWGGLFALIFGMELGVMRLSTVVMVALGSVAFYGLLRQLGLLPAPGPVEPEA